MVSNKRTMPDAAALQREAMEASFVDDAALAAHGYMRGEFWIGRTVTDIPYPLGIGEDYHLLTCAGSRSGKGVGCIIPNLLEFPGSAIVIDPKGENADITADYRRRVLGHKVIVLDPANTTRNVPDDLRGSYNPLKALIEESIDTVGYAQSLAEGLVVPKPESKDPFWDQSAIEVIKGLLLYMAAHYKGEYSEDLNLIRLRELASVGEWDLWKRGIEEGYDIPSNSFDLLLQEMMNTDAFGGLVREVGATIGGMGENTRGNVLGNARTHLGFLGDPRLQSVLTEDGNPDRTFTLDEFRRQDRPLTVYLCLPIEMMYQQGRWLRLIVSQITNYLLRTQDKFEYGRDKPVLMMLDEFFQLGPMPSIINTLTFAAGAGLRLWLIVQDINQLKINYPGNAWETIMAACSVKQFFGINDLTTAKYISEMVGDADLLVSTVTVTETENRSVGGSVANTHGTSKSIAEGTSETESIGRSVGISTSEAISLSRATSSGWSTNSSYGGSTSYGTQVSAGQTINRLPGSGYNQLDTLTNRGGSQNSGVSVNTGGGTNFGNSSGQSGGITDTFGSTTTTGKVVTDSFTTTKGRSRTITDGTNESVTTTRNLTSSLGSNFAVSYAVQQRRVLRPDQLRDAFNRHNLAQLVHVRDWGPMMLYRTPYYSDPDFLTSVQTYEKLKRLDLTVHDLTRLEDQGLPLPQELLDE